MTEQDMKQREAISTMTDGQLTGVELAQSLEALRTDDAAVDAWHCYHLVGDVMRGGLSCDPRRDSAFLQRLRLSLEQEVGAPRLREPQVSSAERTVIRDPSCKKAGTRSAAEAATGFWLHWRF